MSGKFYIFKRNNYLKPSALMEPNEIAFRRKYCTINECLPMVARIKRNINEEDTYEPINMYVNFNKSGTFTVKVKYKINDEVIESVAYVNLFGSVVHFETL
jgi:hypothetical protein